MSGFMPSGWMAVCSLMALSGFGFGLIYFRALRTTVGLIVDGRARAAAVAAASGRIALAVALLILSARLGMAAFLAGSLGFLLARTIALRAARSAY